MTQTHSPAPDPTDPAIAIAGAGAVGLTLAIALAQAGCTVCLIGPPAGPQVGRTVALLDGSVRLLDALGVWTKLRLEAAPLASLRIVDATPSIFRGPPVTFAASAVGLPAFGYNVGNAALIGALDEVAERTPGLTRSFAAVVDHAVDTDGVTVTADDGSTVRARLLVAADGARSAIRERAGITVRGHSYPQVALTTLLHHTLPHRDTSTEFHTREGPFTLVPMGGTVDAPHRSSMVWVMSPARAEQRIALDAAALAREIERQSRGLLGGITLPHAVGRFPIRLVMANTLAAPRVALAGEAAHALPPIGAQGLNLSFRDAATLVDVVMDAMARGTDVGTMAVLESYERARRGDITVRGQAVDGLNRALLAANGPADALRGFGLGALAAIRPLREAVMRQGLRPSSAMPRLMRTPLTDA